MQQGKKAAQGIGTLIIFLSLVLVAAVAAGVLIQTASALESRSYNVGQESQEKVALDIDIIQVYAEDTSDEFINSSSGSFDSVSVVIRVGTASSYLSLDDILVRFDATDFSQSLVYGIQGTTQFDASYIVNGSNHKNGYIANGDLVVLTFNVEENQTVIEQEPLTIRVITKSGVVKPIDITTPSTMLEEREYLYP